jgi:Zierdtviridae DNA polymerase
VDPVDLLWAWLREGWRYRVRQGNSRMVDDPEAYTTRIKHEMELIIGKDFTSYFLMVSDLVRFAKDAGIAVGPGRGSSAASVVCYLLRITEPDPLAFPLTDFSRFVDPTREDLPDIDVDFDDSRRHEVREYAVRKYGEAHVANIGTFTKYKGKNSIVDVARVFSIPKNRIEVVKGLVVDRSGGDSRADASLMDTFEMFPAARAVLEEYPDLQKAIALEGNYRGMSVHAAGLVITTRPITDICAMYTREDKKTGETLTAVSVNKYDAEHLGLMKMDLLGLSTMGMISLALEIAGLTLEDLYRLPYDDAPTIAAFRRADVVGIFQFEGRATRLVCRDVEPNNFLELIDINGLSRPGPLFSGTTAEYIDVQHGRRKPTKIHPILDKITEGTKGQIIYQEQILRALAQFGGLPVKRVHEIRRIISQKLGEAQFNTSARDFAKNAAALHGVTEELAMEVWGRVVTSASYAFVYSHSLSYTLIAYWSMWLKIHYPQAFYAAQLQKTKKEKWPRLIRDAEAHGVRVLGVQPGLSRKTWSVQDRVVPNGQDWDAAVVAGWTQLSGVGDSIADAIIRTEEELAQHAVDGVGFRTTDDLLRVPGIGPAKLEAFRSQIESDDPFGLYETARVLDAVRASIARREILLRRPTVRSDGILDARGGEQVVWIGRVKKVEMKDVFEDERARTGDSMEDIRARLKRPDLPTSCVLHCYDDGDEDVYLRITRFEFPRFKAGIQLLQTNVDVVHAVARRSKGGFGASLYVDRLAVIDPDEGDEDESENES